MPQTKVQLDIGHFRVNHRQGITVTITSSTSMTKDLSVCDCRFQLIDSNPVGEWGVVCWFRRNHAALKRTLSDVTIFLVVIATGEMRVDLFESIIASIVREHLSKNSLIAIVAMLGGHLEQKQRGGSASGIDHLRVI
jgi:hypothetical protein